MGKKTWISRQKRNNPTTMIAKITTTTKGRTKT
jgi:hypothetical protein